MQGRASLRNLYNKCKSHGSKDAKVLITDAELYALLCISVRDLGWQELIEEVDLSLIPECHFYDMPLDWFLSFKEGRAKPDVIMSIMEKCLEINGDYRLFVENLSSMHRRRSKFRRILSQQPVPTMDQIGPRVLLEYGYNDVELLAHWMTWRKWIYDIDNRSAQETGYLFEPILASCLGGDSVSSKHSPVKRIGSNGEPSGKGDGRQIDCLVLSTNTIYELKLRVTIAASGQGRFGEELSFPYEAQVAGYKPVLLVLDPSPSARLEELSAKYLSCGGEVYQGEAAWEHMEKEAGEVMEVFINNYIKPAIKAIENFSIQSPDSLTLKWSGDMVSITGKYGSIDIPRSP